MEIMLEWGKYECELWNSPLESSVIDWYTDTKRG